jgi:hypothetical protein
MIFEAQQLMPLLIFLPLVEILWSRLWSGVASLNQDMMYSKYESQMMSIEG